jgi:hypothetical protein
LGENNNKLEIPMNKVLTLVFALSFCLPASADSFKLKIAHYIETQRCGHRGNLLGEQEILMLGAQLFSLDQGGNEIEIKNPKRVVTWAIDTQVSRWQEPRSLALPLQIFAGSAMTKEGQEWTIKATDKISGASDLLKLEIVKESSSQCGGSL